MGSIKYPVNKNQSNLATDAIATRLYSPGGSVGFAIACFGWGLTPNLPFPNGIEIRQTFSAVCTNVTEDRQTDHAMEKCVACTKAILPNNAMICTSTTLLSLCMPLGRTQNT